MIKNKFYSIFLFVLLLNPVFVNNFVNAKANRVSNLRKNRTKPRKKIIPKGINVKFSTTFVKFFDEGFFENKGQPDKNVYLWQTSAPSPFSELILSWNAFRPQGNGKFSFFVSAQHKTWSNWYKIAEWSSDSQQTFQSAKNPFVHCKHVHLELKKRKAVAFKIKVKAENEAKLKDLKALFVCLSDLDKFCINQPNKNLPSTVIRGVPIQSQMILDHPRRRDLCSPTSLSLLVKYFAGYKRIEESLMDYIPDFAKKVHDDGYLDIYGNWILNVAQAYDSTKGDVFFRVQRLNGFNDLYSFLSRKIPVAVSVRGCLRGAAKPYDKGHFIVVAGWDQKRQALLCIDPAFSSNKKTMRAYKIDSFLQTWGTSRNLSYIALPKNPSFQKVSSNS